MLFKQVHLNGIQSGHITRAFRVWKRPTAKRGGTLTTAVGMLAIDDVRIVRIDDITDDDARASGFSDRAPLVVELEKRSGKPDTSLYRIDFRLAGEDPRVALRNNPNWSQDEVAALVKRFDATDARSKDGAWTRRILHMLADNPRVRAPELAERMTMDTKLFKTRVRTLKGHGLTESLQVGYRLSPRGEAFCAHIGIVADESAQSRVERASERDIADVVKLIAEHGVVLQAAAGPVPTLTYVIAGEAVTKSFWGHKRAQVMTDIFEALALRDDLLACRLIQGKKTWVHRRLWPHLLTLSPRLSPSACEVVEERHSARGAQLLTTTELATWLPADIGEIAAAMSEEEAIAAIGDWVMRELDR